MGFFSGIKNSVKNAFGGGGGGGGGSTTSKNDATNSATIDNHVDFTTDIKIDYDELARAEFEKVKLQQKEFNSKFDGQLTDQQKIDILKLELQKESLEVSKASENRQKQNNSIIIALSLIGGIWALFKYFKMKKGKK